MTYIKSMTPIFWVSVGVYDRKMTAKNDLIITENDFSFTLLYLIVCYEKRFFTFTRLGTILKSSVGVK